MFGKKDIVFFIVLFLFILSIIGHKRMEGLTVKKNIGKTCINDSDCYSNHCKDSVCDLGIDKNSTCRLDNECESGICNKTKKYCIPSV